MSLEKVIKDMRSLLEHITEDLIKSERGNKAASQRVRTGTVRLEKVAKLYRKESIRSEKSTPTKRKSAGNKAKAAAKKTAAAKKPTATKKTATAKKPTAKKSAATTASKRHHVRAMGARPASLSLRRTSTKMAARRPFAR